jgi:hypothetical protein
VWRQESTKTRLIRIKKSSISGLAILAAPFFRTSEPGKMPLSINRQGIIMRRLIVCFTLLALAGCAGTDWSRNLYEGIRQQQKTKADPHAAQPAVAQPDYETYRRERDALKGVADR